jgi:hypothetical protein
MSVAAYRSKINIVCVSELKIVHWKINLKKWKNKFKA